jgi:membrane protease YdiL (CAAX protease family)
VGEPVSYETEGAASVTEVRITTADPTRTTSLPPRATVAILAVLLLVTVVLFGGVVLGLLYIPGGRDAVVPVLATALLVHPVVMLVTLHLGLRHAGSGWRLIGFSRPTRRMLHLLWQVPTIFVLLIAVQGLAFVLTGAPASSGDAMDTLFSGTNPVVIAAAFVGVVLLTPLWEELTFRGLIQGGLRRRLGPLAAALISAAIFAACHGVPILLPYMLTLGLSLAYLREFHRNLWAPLCMHVILNGLATGATLITLVPASA